MTTLKFTLYKRQQKSIRTKIENKNKKQPKTTIDKYNKAIAVCRDLATFISTCGENGFSEKLSMLKKLHSNWQSTQETSDPNEISATTNSVPLSKSAE